MCNTITVYIYIYIVLSNCRLLLGRVFGLAGMTAPTY